jgi:hypothetical protein
MPMKERRASPVWAALLLIMALALPQALANGVGFPPLQATPPASSSHGGCFGNNGVDDSYIPRTVGSLRIALVQPILTSTPYSQYNSGSFYAFYAREAGVTTNVTANLDLLSTNVSSGSGFNQGWGLSAGMHRFFTSQTAAGCGLVIGRNVQVLTDMDVANGALFNPDNRTARFDVVVLPFSEYVEAQEYLAYEDFVASGGTLVMMGHSLEYPVTYNETTKMETLVYAHNWAFHGTYASPIACGSNAYVASCPWAKNNTDWMGSNTCEASCFHTYVFNGSVVNPGNPIGKALYDEFGGTVFKSYLSHEEDTVTNMTGTAIVSVFVNDSKNLIAAYTHQFRKGTVVCLCVFGDDIIATDPSAQYFLLQGMIYGTSVTVSTSTVSTGASSSNASVASSTTAAYVHPPATTLIAPRPGAPTWVLAAVGAAAAAAAVVGVSIRRRSRPRA